MDVDANVSIIGTEFFLSGDNHKEPIVKETEKMDNSSATNEILSNIKCLVETYNEDEIDTSEETVNSLSSLGATICNSLGEHLTHYITSYPSIISNNKRHKRILVAEMLGIPVVSSTWIKDCKVQQQQLPIQPYLIKGILYPSMRKPAAGELFYTASKEKAARVVTDQDGISPSKMDNNAIHAGGIASTEECTANNRQPEQPRAVSVGLPLSRSISGTEIPHINTSVTSPGIVLPSFREISPLVIPAEVLEKVQKRRRSERICDLGEDDSDFDLFIPAHKHSRLEEERRWEVIEKIPVSAELPVVYEPGNEGDVLEISTVFPSSASEKRRRSGSGIQGLPVRGVRGTPPGSRLRSGRLKEATSVSSDRPGKKQRCQTAAEFTDAQVVLALTGFSDKAGERSTLLHMLREFIRSPKKTVPICCPSEEQTTETVGGPEGHREGATGCATSEPEADGLSVLASSSSASIASSVQDVESEAGRKKRRGRSPKGDPDATDVQPDPTQAWQVDPLTSSVAILADPNDYSAGACTHVIANSKAPCRTLRTLFALARGQCVVTESWVYQSVSQESWADVRDFLHPRYAYRPHQINVFNGKKICVLDSVNPPREVLVDLVQAAGARVTRDITEAGVALVVFGDLCAANEWVAGKVRRRRPSTHVEVEESKGYARKRKVVTCKHIFNCIEEGVMSAPAPDCPDLVRPEHLMVLNFPDQKVEEYMQRLHRWDLMAPKVAAKQVRLAKIAQKQVTSDKEFWIEGVMDRRKNNTGQSAEIPKKVTRSTSATEGISLPQQSLSQAVRMQRKGRESVAPEQLPTSPLVDGADTTLPASRLRLKARSQTSAAAVPKQYRLGSKREPLRNAVKQQRVSIDLKPEAVTPEIPVLAPEAEMSAEPGLVPQTAIAEIPVLAPEAAMFGSDQAPEIAANVEIHLQEAQCEDAVITQPPRTSADACGTKLDDRMEECCTSDPADASSPDADMDIVGCETASRSTVSVPANDPTASASLTTPSPFGGLETALKPSPESVSTAATVPCAVDTTATSVGYKKDSGTIKRTVSTLVVATSLLELSCGSGATSSNSGGTGHYPPSSVITTSTEYDLGASSVTAGAAIPIADQASSTCSDQTTSVLPEVSVVSSVTAVDVSTLPGPVRPVPAEPSVSPLAVPILPAHQRPISALGAPAAVSVCSPPSGPSAHVSTATVPTVATERKNFATLWDNTAPSMLRGLLSGKPQQTTKQLEQQRQDQLRRQKEQEQRAYEQLQQLQQLQALQQEQTQRASTELKRKMEEFVDPYENYDASKIVAVAGNNSTQQKLQYRDEQIQVGCPRRSLDVMDSMAVLDNRVGGRLPVKPMVRTSYPLSLNSSSHGSGSRSNGFKGAPVGSVIRQPEAAKAPVVAASVSAPTGILPRAPRVPIKITSKPSNAFLASQCKESQSSGTAGSQFSGTTAGSNASVSPRTLGCFTLSSPRPHPYNPGKPTSISTTGTTSASRAQQPTTIAAPQSRIVWKQ